MSLFILGMEISQGLLKLNTEILSRFSQWKHEDGYVPLKRMTLKAVFTPKNKVPFHTPSDRQEIISGSHSPKWPFLFSKWLEMNSGISHHIPFSGKSHCIEDIALQQRLMSGQQNQPVAQDKKSHTPAKADPPPVHKRAQRSTGMPLCFLNAVCFCISTAHLNRLPGPKWVFYEQKSWLLPQKKKRISVIICVADAQRAGHASSFKQRKSISILLLSRSQSKFKRCRPGEISGGNGSLTPAICPYLEFECTSSRCLLGIF